jgi:hypothetical protein
VSGESTGSLKSRQSDGALDRRHGDETYLTHHLGFGTVQLSANGAKCNSPGQRPGKEVNQAVER